MTEDELCPETKEYIEWFDRETTPRMRKFAAHLVNCPKCQRLVLSIKDQAGFDMLKMSEEEVLRRVRAVLEQGEGSV